MIAAVCPLAARFLVLVLLFNVLLLVLFRARPLQPGPHRNPGNLNSLYHTPAFQLLQGAQAKVKAHQGLFQVKPQLQAQDAPQSCCTADSTKLQGVLSAAAAFATAAAAAGEQGGNLLAKDRAQHVALRLREQFAGAWAAVLQPFATATPGPAGSNSTQGSCTSVQLLAPRQQHEPLPPAQQAAAGPAVHNRAKTGLLLVLGDWGQLGRMLGLYALNLFTIWAYASTHGYGLELYVHGRPLPQDMPVFYIKVLGTRHLFDALGYQHVLYLDFDTFTSPHSAPPLGLLYGAFPAASLLVQAEHNVCAAALLWRNTPDSRTLLQAWWDAGARGCCPTFPHDQTALKHVLLAYLANVTQQPGLYGPDMQRSFRLPPQPPRAAAGAAAGVTPALLTDSSAPAAGVQRSAEEQQPSQAAAADTPSTPHQAAASSAGQVLSVDRWPHPVRTWLALRPKLLQAGSAVGFVGLDVHYPAPKGSAYSRVVLHNCLGFWWGCVPFDTPALLYHTGHWVMEELSEPWLAQRLLHSIKDWSSALGLQPSADLDA